MSQAIHFSCIKSRADADNRDKDQLRLDSLS